MTRCVARVYLFYYSLFYLFCGLIFYECTHIKHQLPYAFAVASQLAQRLHQLRPSWGPEPQRRRCHHVAHCGCLCVWQLRWVRTLHCHIYTNANHMPESPYLPTHPRPYPQSSPPPPAAKPAQRPGWSRPPPRPGHSHHHQQQHQECQRPRCCCWPRKGRVVPGRP